MIKKKVLWVTYDFPPIGGGGIQRNVKFLKYLSRLGWETSVLTVKERAFYVYDTSLLEEVKDSKIYRSDSMDPISVSFKLKKILSKLKKKKDLEENSNPVVNESAWYVSVYRKIRDWVLLPDGYGGWIPFATRLGSKIVRENRPDIIFGTFPGPSNAFTTYNVATKFNIPYVIDFRDAWLDDPYTTFPSILHRKYHQYYEKKIICSAHKILVYGDPLKEILENKYPILNGKIDVITNGFDPEDFEGLIPKNRDNSKIRIVYSGAVYVDRRETYYSFIEAVTMLPKPIKERLEIIFVGDKLKWAADLVNLNNLENIISFTGYLSHKEALNYLASADSALLFLAKGDVVALTGKIFEYIGLGLPIIACIEPNGACAEMLKNINHDQGVCSPSDSNQIAQKIIALVEGNIPRLNNENMKVFSRKYHSERLDKILSQIITQQGN